MPTIEEQLPENATTEQIEEFVDSIVAEEETERKAADDENEGEPGKKTDSQRIADDEVAPDDTTAGDEKSADDAAADGSEDGAGESESPKWLTDDLKAEVEAWGFSEDQIAEFSSKEELDRALSLVYRAIPKAKEGEESDEEKPSGPLADRKRRPDGTLLPKDAEGKKEATEEGGFKLDLDADYYGQEIVGAFNALDGHYRSKLSALEERLAEVESAEERRVVEAETREFDEAVDSLGFADLFGKTGKETEKQFANRKLLFSASKAVFAHLAANGKNPRMGDKSLVMRAARMEFADQVAKKERQALTKKMTKQHNSRMGGGAEKPRDQQESTLDEMKRYYKELEADS